jgi:hypothetical protein
MLKGGVFEERGVFLVLWALAGLVIPQRVCFAVVLRQ